MLSQRPACYKEHALRALSLFCVLGQRVRKGNPWPQGFLDTKPQVQRINLWNASGQEARMAPYAQRRLHRLDSHNLRAHATHRVAVSLLHPSLLMVLLRPHGGQTRTVEQLHCHHPGQ